MRRVVAFLLILLLLYGCTPQQAAPAYITVSLSLPNGCSVVENGLQIVSGEDAEFELILEESYELSNVDYNGDYTIESQEGKVFLSLKNVLYPTLATVTLTSQHCTITYEPNGGDGAAKTESYDKSLHLRPNTSIGTDSFSREGYVLIGWNTEPDGTGEAVGLGSRISVPGDSLTLYAQWVQWSDVELFDWEYAVDGVRITGYRGTEDTVVVPSMLGSVNVAIIGTGAFTDCTATHIILPETIKTLETSAFSNCQLRELTFFDNIENFSDESFTFCQNFTTVHINAIEAPWGYDYRRESCLADKVDILIEAQGKKKIVFYAGCSMWYNLDGQMVQDALGDSYQVINLGLNGVMNSSAQMQILTNFLEDGDIFFHTPELSSPAQLMQRTEMINHDRKLWSGMEYNYDLVALLDIQSLPEFFDILYYWLSTKECTSSYTDVYRDSRGNNYVDQFGSASFYRNGTAETLSDKVYLDPAYVDADAMKVLESHYQKIQDRGVKIYVSFACLNLDAVPEDQRDNVELMDGLFRAAFEEMEGITFIGSLWDHLYQNTDFYDTNYHLRTAQTQLETGVWLRDLQEQMLLDGLWPETE